MKYIALVDRSIADCNGACAEKFTEAFLIGELEPMSSVFERIEEDYLIKQIRIVPLREIDLEKNDNKIFSSQYILNRAKAEIKWQEELIDQLRIALMSINAIGNEKVEASGEDALRCFSIAKAALEAADRKE